MSPPGAWENHPGIAIRVIGSGVRGGMIFPSTRGGHRVGTIFAKVRGGTEKKIAFFTLKMAF